MPPEEITGSAGDDDLRSMLSAAFDADAEAPATTDAPEAAPAATEKPAERARDDLGRFAPKGDEPPPQAAPEAAKAAPVPKIKEPAAVADPEIKPVAEGQQGEQPTAKAFSPPPGWSVAAKTQFDALPAPVKEAVARREEEISNGFAKLAEYKGLDSYVEMARQHGRALPDVLQAYVNAENMLTENPVNGIAQLCRMYNVDPVRIAQEAFGYNPQMHQQGQPRGAPNQTGTPQPQSFDPRLASYLQTLEAQQRTLAEQVQNWDQQMRDQRDQQDQQEQSAVNSEIASFSAKPEHRYFENVRETMSQLLSTGAAKDLPDAYEKACWAHPEIRKTFIDEQLAQSQAKLAADAKAKSDQAKRTSKSLSAGAPIAGASLAGTPQATLRDELLSAWDEAQA